MTHVKTRFLEVPQASGESAREEDEEDEEQRWERERKERQEQRQREQEEARERELQELEKLETEMVMMFFSSSKTPPSDLYIFTKKRQPDEKNINSICLTSVCKRWSNQDRNMKK